MISCGQTDKGIVRKDNQDYFQIEQLHGNKLILSVVCDGMGGASAGNVASRLAAETFIQTLSDQPSALLDDELVGDALTDAMMAANRVVYEGAKAHRDYKGMGTTLVGAVTREEKSHIINVGDSRAYHISGDIIVQVTRDHSLVEDMVARGDITREEALTHPNRNLITRALGTDEKVGRDLFTVELKPGDRLLLCSDGLTNLVSDEEILQEISRYDDPDKCCEMLIHLGLARGGSDNITALIVDI
ncbi:MAG: Stp1/IreP family PP2C-type Ser/Thr phosphatase [Oscillospiraceae bacterium]|nr:Stp1/IreP family PP2C-type Ser/Thr phosphatase [Oscillospiraceae bacterium]